MCVCVGVHAYIDMFRTNCLSFSFLSSLFFLRFTRSADLDSESKRLFIDRGFRAYRLAPLFSPKPNGSGFSTTGGGFALGSGTEQSYLTRGGNEMKKGGGSG